MPWTLKEIKAAIPARLFVRNTALGLTYLLRDIIVASFLWFAASKIDPFSRNDFVIKTFGSIGAAAIRWTAWLIYWWFQGLTFTGIWVIGHECGHGAFSDYKLVNNMVGFITHTALWTPYFSWKISHHRHHSNHASMERDEVYVPKTRSDLGIPKEGPIDWDEIFGDTPLYTLLMLIRQQLLAFPAYLMFNVSGQKGYPKWTNHFDPSSILFTKEQRNAVILSNIGIAAMVWAVTYASTVYGVFEVIKFYGIPWLAVTHCPRHAVIMITYLHHTDATLPHYRGKEWSYQRGAAATVDRNFLGWQGRTFLHDVAHYHVIHHFFPKMPFYHGEEATQYLRNFIGEHYAYSDKPVFKALWDTYNDCQFVEDDGKHPRFHVTLIGLMIGLALGDILFYRNKKGEAVRRPAARKAD
ncbi:hypothetical protein VNI00_000256 [Paramarasmius palmivorus]|uniref:Fatty acid desaturase domain-containing protein n=1 Tax=Paramarasmius palmivorus TaxID=297713 RepID=A0AAW0EEU9_9AGAR